MRSHTYKFYTKPGRKIRVQFYHSLYIFKMHIIAVVDEEMIVYKCYGKHKQWWHYGVEHWGQIRRYHENAKLSLNDSDLKSI